MRIAAGSVRTIRTGPSRASTPARAAARERLVHGAMPATMIPNRAHRRASKLNLIKRAGVIDHTRETRRRDRRADGKRAGDQRAATTRSASAWRSAAPVVVIELRAASDAKLAVQALTKIAREGCWRRGQRFPVDAARYPPDPRSFSEKQGGVVFHARHAHRTASAALASAALARAWMRSARPMLRYPDW